MAKTATERKKEQRKRDLALGIHQVNIRVHTDDIEAIRAHARALLKRRLNENKAN